MTSLSGTEERIIWNLLTSEYKDKYNIETTGAELLVEALLGLDDSVLQSYAELAAFNSAQSDADLGKLIGNEVRKYALKVAKAKNLV